MQTLNRNYGIDLLRAVSMYMILVLHLVNHGDVIGTSNYMSSQYLASWFLSVICYCAVDCFAAISGYVGVDRGFKWKRLFSLWCTVAFYSVGITIIFSIISPGSVSFRQWASAIAPIITDQYWYMTAYFGMLLFVPIMNSALNNLSREALFYFMITIIIVLCLMPNLTHFMDTSWGLKNGYSTLWLIIMYLMGGISNRMNIASKLRKSHLLLLFILSSIFIFLSKLIIDGASLRILGKVRGGSTFIDYTSPFILLNAIILLLLFSRIKIQSHKCKRFISFISATALGVYLIHVHPLVWDQLYGSTSCAASFSPLIMTVTILFAAALIFLACSIIEKVRQYVFRFLGISVLCEKMERIWLLCLEKCYSLVKL